VTKKRTIGKKEQFTRPDKSKLPLIAGMVVILLALGFVYSQFVGNDTQAEVVYFGEPVTAERSYLGRFISMTAIEPLIEEGQIKFPLADLERYSIVSFSAENDQGTVVPLMAYITPSGRLFAGSSMCEPCRGQTFSLAGETLVCDACRTTYTIEDHQFISGAVVCGSYPPVNMNGRVVDGMVVIDLQEVLNWRIRAL